MNEHDPAATRRAAAPEGFEASALGRGLVTAAMAQECRELHGKLAEVGLPMSLGEVYVKKGYLGPSQVETLEAELVDINAHAIPGYHIVEKIAVGGMGSVYKARQLSMDRIVAIKVLLPKFANDSEGRERFLREARAVARLSHPNVVAGIDVGDVHGIYYFVMEFLDGESADHTLRREGRLPWRESTKIVRQVVLALEHAHAAGLIHRDIKPSNIMLLKNGVAKLADLGLARTPLAVDVALTQSGMIVGSPAYLSPEQATADREIDIRSDIYSLGLTFYEFMSGERAHPGHSPASILTALLTRDIPLARLAALQVPPEVVAVVAKMARREVGERYQTPSALLDDLDAILAPGGGMVSALRPALLPRRAPAAKRGGLRRAGVVAALVLVAGLGAGWLWREFRPVAAPAAAPSTAPGSIDRAVPPPPSAGAAPIDMLDALARAQGLAPGGEPYHVELEGARYSVDFALAGRTTNVELAAYDGSVIHVSHESEDHGDEVEICKLPLPEAIRAAQARVAGRPVEAEIRLPPGRAEVVVRLQDGAGATVEVVVDCDTADAERAA